MGNSKSLSEMWRIKYRFTKTENHDQERKENFWKIKFQPDFMLDSAF